MCKPCVKILGFFLTAGISMLRRKKKKMTFLYFCFFKTGYKLVQPPQGLSSLTGHTQACAWDRPWRGTASSRRTRAGLCPSPVPSSQPRRSVAANTARDLLDGKIWKNLEKKPGPHGKPDSARRQAGGAAGRVGRTQGGGPGLPRRRHPAALRPGPALPVPPAEVPRFPARLPRGPGRDEALPRGYRRDPPPSAPRGGAGAAAAAAPGGAGAAPAQRRRQRARSRRRAAPGCRRPPCPAPLPLLPARRAVSGAAGRAVRLCGGRWAPRSGAEPRRQ